MNDIMLKSALKYASWGWKVFPLIPNEKIPRANSKGFKDATSHPEAIKAMWELEPGANIGLATGKMSGIDVIDFDPRNGSKQSMMDIRVQYGGMPKTIKTTTPQGGEHYFLKHHDTPKPAKILAGVDVKTDGGYVILPPSATRHGKYLWHPNYHPERDNMLKQPQWLIELYIAKKSKEYKKYQLPDLLEEGERNDGLASIIGKLLHHFTKPEAYKLAYGYNQSFTKPPLDDEELCTIFDSISAKEDKRLEHQ